MFERFILITAALLLAIGPPGATATDWVPPDPGLLRDAAFDAGQRGERRAWSTGQHAGRTSYRFDFEPGILRIERIGPEPWGQVRQRVDAKDLAGKTLAFSAELSGNLSESEEHPTITPTGLGVRVLGYRPGLPPLVGKAILMTADGEPAMGPQDHEWTPHTVRFEVPEGATDIEVSIRLGLYGTLSARGPRLVVVDPSAGE